MTECREVRKESREWRTERREQNGEQRTERRVECGKLMFVHIPVVGVSLTISEFNRTIESNAPRIKSN